MGKNTVTEDDLLAGVGGGFGNIGKVGAGRPVRDNPFRDTRTEQPPSIAKPIREPRREEIAPEQPAPKPMVSAAAVPPQQSAPDPEQRSHPLVPQPPVRAPKVRALKRVRKADTYSEKMSTFLTPEMRDELEMAARLLQRNRLVKGESITVHSLIRCGIRVVTEMLEFTDADVISSEEELDALVRRKLGR